MIIHGLISTPLFLYGATYFTPYMTRLAEETKTLSQSGLISWATFEGPDIRYILANGFSGNIVAILLGVAWLGLYVMVITSS